MWHALSHQGTILQQMGTAGLIAGCGDVTAQSLQREFAQSRETRQAFDWRRTAAFCAFGVGYTGGAQSILFRLYAHRWPLAPTSAPVLTRARPVLMRLLVNQFVVVPTLYFPLLFAGTETLRGRTLAEAEERYDSRWWSTAKLNWCLWLPAQVRELPLPCHQRCCCC